MALTYTVEQSTNYPDIGSFLRQHNTAAVAPGVTADDAHGYSVGSRWLDSTHGVLYVCVDATTGAAVWVNVGGVAQIANKQSLAAAAYIDTCDLTLCSGGVIDVCDSNGGVALVRLAAGGQSVGAVTAVNPTSSTGAYVAGTPATGQYGLTVVGGKLRITAGATATTVNVSVFPRFVHA